MCGIAGFAGSGSESQLRKMTQAIIRRGPDDEGFYLGEGVGFGFRRLSIIDLSGGHQPLSNENGSVWVMLNGEIYDFKDLRDKLINRGHIFKTMSDTETIVHAYEEYGDQCFEFLQGMFAIAIWDQNRQRLVLARDRLGKKPLYWTQKDGTIWFSSEIKSLIAAGAINKEIDLQSLSLYFRTDAVPTPLSIFKNVFKLEPASAMAWSNGKIEKQWSFWGSPQGPCLEGTATDFVHGLRDVVDKAVAKRMVADVPLGLFLSGGLDSAVVAESAARQSSSPVKAFTIGFDDASHDESQYARQTASALGLEHYVEILNAESALGMIDQAVALLDEPLADASILPQLLLSRFTRQKVTVALSGDGGDELLLGYQHIPAHVWMNRLQWVPEVMREMAADALSAMPAGQGYFSFGFKAQRLARGLTAQNPWARDVQWRGAMSQECLQNLLLPEVANQIQTQMAEQVLQARAMEAGDVGFWRQWTWAYLRTFLMDEVLVKVDRATMWYALEARAPLLDTDVVEYLLRVPNEFKLGRWSGKRLFKELIKNRVPSTVLNHPKHGFAVPVGKWLNGPLADRLKELTNESRLNNQGIFDAKKVSQMITEHATGRIDRRKELWALFMFQLWYDSWAK